MFRTPKFMKLGLKFYLNYSIMKKILSYLDHAISYVNGFFSPWLS
jgi:hypothetical protein